MRKNNNKELTVENLLLILKRDFNDVVDVNNNKVEIHHYKLTIKEILFIAFFTLLPYFLFLIVNEGDFAESLRIWPVCLITPFFSLVVIIKQLKYDNHVIFDISDKTIRINSKPILGINQSRAISFDKINSIFHSEKKDHKVVFNLLSLRLLSKEIICIQEFSKAKEVSIVLNNLLQLLK